MSVRNTKDYVAYLPIREFGGFGDIVASISLVEDFKKKGINYKIDFNKINSRIMYYELQGLNPNLDYDDNFDHSNDSGISNRIDINVIEDSRSQFSVSKSKIEINIEEYNRIYFFKNNYNTKHFQIHTGLNFSPGTYRTIQAGIYQRPSLEKLLDEVDLDPIKSKNKLKQKLNLLSLDSDYGSSLDLDDDFTSSSWSLMYPSSVDSVNFYMNILNKSKKHLNKPLTVFSLACDDSRKMQIQSLSRRRRFNYKSLSSNIDNKSNITILELGNISDYLFQQILANVDAPSLITGDHSLSQMLQKTDRDSAVPFLYQLGSWKVSLGGNIDALMREVDPDSANIFSSYIYNANHRYLMHDDVPLNIDKKDIAKLFYDKKLQDNFVKAQKNIKHGSLKKRFEVMSKEKALLQWNIPDLISKIVLDLNSEKSNEEIWKDITHD